MKTEKFASPSSIRREKMLAGVRFYRTTKLDWDGVAMWGAYQKLQEVEANHRDVQGASGFDRSIGDERLRCLFNLARHPAVAPQLEGWRPIMRIGPDTGPESIGAFGAIIAERA